MPTMNRINVRIEPDLKQQLEAVALEEGITPSEVVRKALKAHLGTRPKPKNALELAQELGVVGIFAGLPSDLTTNPKHMDGFGE